MSQHSRSLGCVVAVALLLLSSTAALPAAEPAKESARIDAFAKEGDAFFALSLSPAMARPAAKPRDVVIFFDTSASQMGRYRDKALAALDATLAGLGPSDRVRLLAVDLNAIPLMDKFAAPGSAETRQAIAALRDRVPLGSTDMGAALSAASQSFAGGDGARGRAALYIGDGMSTANLLASDATRPLVDRLVEKRVPLNSYAVGPRVDTGLLACLANQTGGALAIDGENMTGAQFGNWLAAAVDAPVVWPKSISLPKSLQSVSGDRALPLRFDRDTILVGTGELPSAAVVKMSADADGRAQELTWKLAPAQSNPDYSFLSQVVEAAQHDGGLSLPALGSQGLAEMRRMLTQDAESLTRLGRVALASGDTEQARRLAEQALRVDAADSEAGAILRLAQRAGAPGSAVPQMKFGTLRDGADKTASAADSEPAAGDGDGALLAEAENQRRVMQESVKTEVRTAINDARTRMVSDPDVVSEDLKLELEQVRKAPELEPGLRAQLAGQLETALQDAARRASEKVEREIHEQEVQSELDARQQLNRELVVNQQKADSLMIRFNALLDERRYRDAEDAATLARDILPVLRDTPEPGNTIATTAGPLEARTSGYIYDMIVLKERRQKGVIETLYSVEVAQIPQSDEPPIIYPSAEEWMLKTERRKKYAEEVSLYSPGSAEAKIYSALNEKTKFEFADTALSDVVDYIKQKHEIEVQLDNKGLADAAVDPSAPITRSVDGISLRSALRLILEDLDLTYVVQDEVLKITSKEKADEILTTRVYPVADLVIPIFGGMAGMMGGMGGGMGGMGGGMMGGMGGGMGGGMMGGMGGGMGGGMMGGMGGMGGGMGGMGGGMFNVPPQNLPVQGLRAFAVKDDRQPATKTAAPAAKKDLKLSAKPAPATVPSAATKKPASVAKPAPRIKIPAGADPDTAWNDYFAAHDESPAAVRETVRQLTAEENFGQVVALVMAALKNQQAQPWMYETMGLAMQADGRSLEDIDRTLMSAVDFVDGADHMMYLAEYLAGVGLEKRALQLLRQVSALEPTMPKPYVSGLRIGKKLDDLDAIQWATLGILGLAWTDDEAAVWQDAFDVAAATLNRLRSESRKSEADDYQQKVDQTLIRDVFVRISWSGEADIDLMVEEPSGTVCSARNPRTASGGLLLGDSIHHLEKDKKSAVTSSESYCCPNGFDGTYRIVIRRVWGKLATGKVSVDIYTHYLSDKQTEIHKQIPFADDEAMVLFDLKGGRRKEPLAKQQLATAVAKQVHVGQQILAQQLAAASSPATLSSFLNSRGVGPAVGGIPFAPFFLQGAVGYQPVITVLPSGASMRTLPTVISHDRRYVRVTPIPMFTGISQVNTFNFVTGGSGTSNGSTSGSNFGGGSGIGGGGTGGGGTGF